MARMIRRVNNGRQLLNPYLTTCKQYSQLPTKRHFTIACSRREKRIPEWHKRGKVGAPVRKPVVNPWDTRGRPETLDHIVRSDPTSLSNPPTSQENRGERPLDKFFPLNTREYQHKLYDGLAARLIRDEEESSKTDSRKPFKGLITKLKTNPENTLKRERKWAQRMEERKEKKGISRKFEPRATEQPMREDFVENSFSDHGNSMTYTPPKLEPALYKPPDNTHDEYKDREGLGGESDDGVAFLRYRGAETGIEYNPSRYESRTVLVKKAKDIPRLAEDSEFIYGLSAVQAALVSGKRKIYKLWLYESNDGRLIAGSNKDGVRASWMRNTAIPKKMTHDLSLLDAMSKGLPHNGVCLECSPIKTEILPIRSLAKCLRDSNTFSATRSGVRALDDTEVGDIVIPLRDKRRSYPFVLVIDNVITGGNIGAMIRSAYYLGADAVILSEGCSKISNSAVKASSGAIEFMPMYEVPEFNGFLSFSMQNNWQFVAAMPTDTLEITHDIKHKDQRKRTWYDLNSIGDILEEGPVALLVGGESLGIRETLLSKIDKYITIVPCPDVHELVDSVNVSVATALAMDRILRPPNPGAKPKFMSWYDPTKPTKEPVEDDGNDLFDLKPAKKSSSRALVVET